MMSRFFEFVCSLPKVLHLRRLLVGVLLLGLLGGCGIKKEQDGGTTGGNPNSSSLPMQISIDAN